MADTISKYDDIIDSRDVIARIEELESDRADLETAIEEAETDAARTEASSRLADWDADSDRAELDTLRALAAEASGYAADWHHGEALIRDSYFETYAEELARDCGMIPDNLAWPCTCIDWAQAARELQQDYTSVEFDGITYWIR